jgi:hypothetical protein
MYVAEVQFDSSTHSEIWLQVHKRKMAEIAVGAVVSVCDWEHRDVNFDLIKVCALASR